MRNTIIQGDALSELKKLPSESAHCIITSPPYWGLRDYGVKGQLGLEPSPAEFIRNLVKVFRECKRVLRKDGTLWINIGDTRVQDGGSGTGGNLGRINRAYQQRNYRAKRTEGYQRKEIIGIPWLLAFALQKDGWILRSDIIWSKPNCMPESAADRPTKSHEYVFMLTKSQKYYYDGEAIKEPMTDESKKRYQYDFSLQRAWRQDSHPQPGGKVPRFGMSPAGRNKRSVWNVPVASYEGEHYASYPPALIEPIIKACVPKEVCTKCHKPRVRITEKQFVPQEDVSIEKNARKDMDASNGREGSARGYNITRTTGWTTCSCKAPFAPGIVLDPFMGVATTMLVALQQGVDSVGIELNPASIKQGLERCKPFLLQSRLTNDFMNPEDKG